MKQIKNFALIVSIGAFLAGAAGCASTKTTDEGVIIERGGGGRWWNIFSETDAAPGDPMEHTPSRSANYEPVS